MFATLFCIWFLYMLMSNDRERVEERHIVYIIRERPQPVQKAPEPQPIDPRFDYVLEDDDCAYEMMYPSEIRER
jgi:hypothetical protein